MTYEPDEKHFGPNEGDLAALRPLVQQLRAIQRRCRPFSPDYDAVAVSLAALDECAETITGRVGFFGAQNDTVGPIMPRLP